VVGCRLHTPCSRTVRIVVLAVMLCLAACACAPPAWGDAQHAQVATSSEMATARTLGLPGMVPITGDNVADGTYDIQAESSSSFFKIESAVLTVKDGQMSAQIAMRSSSYECVYMGTGREAAQADAEDYIPFDGKAMTFTVPVEALDADLDCAAFSSRRHKWYDRTIMFYAATLPEDALLVELPEYGDPEDAGESTAKTAQDVAAGAVQHEDGYEAVAIDKPDGTYSIEVNMTGGSGRAQVSSPTWLIVNDGHAYAKLLWSSPNYDYMVVNDVKYLNKTTDGSNSTFVIPITAMDEEIVAIADTTAMGDPLEIEYHLTFYSGTVGDKDMIPQEAAVKVLYIAIAVIVVGGILNYALKKRRKQ
jgi:hypothetical protein